MEGEKPWEKAGRVFRHKRLFFKTLGLLTGLSLLTALAFGLFFNQITVKSQKENIENLNLHQLQRVSSNVDLTFDLMAKGMTRSLWSEDFISLMIRPDSQDADLAYRVIRILQDSVEENELVRKSYLFLPGYNEVYLYSGTHIPLEELGDKDMVNSYLKIREEGRDPEETSEWRLLLYNRRIFLASDFCLPNFVGVLFYEIDRSSLYDIIQMENSQYNTTIYVTDANGTLLFDYMAAGPQREDLNKTSLFTTEDSRNPHAEYYRYISPRLGWNYFIRTDTGQKTASVSSLLSLIVPFLLVYIVVSQMFTVYITKSVYQPINRLIQITTNPKKRRDKPGTHRKTPNEADILELAYLESWDKNEQHRELMEAISGDVLEQQIRSILIGKEVATSQVLSTLEAIGRPELRSGYYIVLVGELEYTQDEELTILEKELYQRSLLKILNEMEGQEYRICVCSMSPTRAAAAFCFSEEVSVLRIRENCKKMQASVEEQAGNLPYRLKLGHGNVYDDLMSLPFSYHEALENIRYQQYLAEDEEPEKESVPYEARYYTERSRRICDLAEKGNPEAALEECRLLLTEIHAREKGEEACYRFLVDEVMEHLISCRISKEELREAKIDLLEPAPSKSDVEDFYQRALTLLSENGKKSHNRYVSEAKEYIAQHYMEGKLRLNEISEAMGISYSYLSGVFTEGTGEGLTSWLNHYRVEQAKRFLMETRLNVSEIGYKCGFNSAQSFGRVFKKYTGMSPKQYRERRMVEKRMGEA